MGRTVLLAVTALYWTALLVTVIAVSAVGKSAHLRHPLYTLFVAAAIVLAGAAIRYPIRRDTRRPSSIGSVRPPRPRVGEPARRLPSPFPSPPALTETTQVLPGAVKAAAWRAARGTAEVAPQPVAVEEPTADMGGLGLYLSGHAAGAHPEHDDGQRPDVDHLRGFAEGAVDRGRSEDDEETN